MSCEICGNTIGFAFGTCCNCGWNDIEKVFRWVEVDVKDLPLDIRDYLILKHHKRKLRYKEN